MKYKYLESYELSELIEYCRTNAVKIVINHNNEDKDKIRYYRHLYYGFVYCKKVFLLNPNSQKYISINFILGYLSSNALNSL